MVLEGDSHGLFEGTLWHSPGKKEENGTLAKVSTGYV